MAEGYHAGRIIIEARMDTSDISSQLSDIQKNILAHAATTESVFKNIGRSISESMKSIFGSIHQAGSQSGKKVAEINAEITQIDNRMSAYQKQISVYETKLKSLSVNIISLSSSRRELNSETQRSIQILQNESQAIDDQVKKFKKLYAELNALKKKRLQDRYESFIRQQNSEINTELFTNNREAATGAIIESVSTALKYWKEAFGSFSGYGINELKFLLTGQAGYSGGMEIFKKLGEEGARQIIQKAKALSEAMSANIRNSPITRFPRTIETGEERRSDQLKKMYDKMSLENYLSHKRRGMTGSEIEADKIKQKLQAVLNEYRLTYEMLEQREHENMLHRGEITKQEFLRLEGLYRLTKEKIEILSQENDFAYRSFLNLAVTGLQELANGFGQTFVSAIREGQNVLSAFGHFFKNLFNQLINQVVALIAKLLVVRTLTSLFGGGGLIGKAFGLSHGGGISSSGKIYRAAGGMYVNAGSHSTADDVPVFLSRGEGVLNARITRLLGGEPAIHALNRLGSFSGAAHGGYVPRQEISTTNVYVEGSIVDTAGLIGVLNRQAKNSGARSLYQVGGLV